MSKVKIAKKILKGAYKAGRFRERWAPGSMRPARKTKIKTFLSGAVGGGVGGLIGQSIYDRIKGKGGVK